jgi:uridylate kinase
MFIASEFQDLCKLGVECGIVVGGGNIYRGQESKGSWVGSAAAHQVGMMATVLNGKMLEEAFWKLKVSTSLLCAFRISGIAEAFDARSALEKIEREKRILIFVGGTGNPFLTTDTAAVLRALEIGADAVMKATKVDGVYSADPHTNPQAKKYTSLTFDQALDKNLQVMDRTAFTMARENGLRIHVFRFEKGSFVKAALGKTFGTLIH